MGDGKALVPAVASMAREDDNDGFKEVVMGRSALADGIALATCPIAFIQGWFVLPPREEAISLHFGQLTGHFDQSGCNWVNPCGVELLRVSTAQVSTMLPTQRVLDKSGNPVVVSVVLNYRIEDAAKALLNVQSPTNFIETRAQAVVKEIVSHFSYDELKTETASINERMTAALQPKVNVCGTKVQSVTLNELNYSSEIAQAMLKKQQANAVVQARELLVEGAVSLSRETVQRLEDANIHMEPQERSRLMRNLVLVTSGDVSASPVLQL